MRTLNHYAIVLARYNSSRFPGKALHSIEGRTLLEWCLHFLKKSNQFKTVLATSDQVSDDSLVYLAENMGIPCYRGSLNDVYKRVIGCIDYHKIDSFARINGDSPFPQIPLIESAFKQLEMSQLDFITNLYPRTFPYGVSVEVFRAATFKENYINLEKPDDHEHITSFFYRNIEQFNYENIVSSGVQNKDLRLVVDSPEDLPVISKILKDSNIALSPDYRTIIKLIND